MAQPSTFPLAPIVRAGLAGIVVGVFFWVGVQRLVTGRVFAGCAWLVFGIILTCARIVSTIRYFQRLETTSAQSPNPPPGA